MMNELNIYVWGIRAGFKQSWFNTKSILEVETVFATDEIRTFYERYYSDFFSIQKTPNYTVVSIINPNCKDAVDRQAYIVISLVIENKYCFQGNVIVTLKKLMDFYNAKQDQDISPVNQFTENQLFQIIKETGLQITQRSKNSLFVNQNVFANYANETEIEPYFNLEKVLKYATAYFLPTPNKQLIKNSNFKEVILQQEEANDYETKFKREKDNNSVKEIISLLKQKRIKDANFQFKILNFPEEHKGTLNEIKKAEVRFKQEIERDKEEEEEKERKERWEKIKPLILPISIVGIIFSLVIGSYLLKIPAFLYEEELPEQEYASEDSKKDEINEKKNEDSLPSIDSLALNIRILESGKEIKNVFDLREKFSIEKNDFLKIMDRKWLLKKSSENEFEEIKAQVSYDTLNALYKQELKLESKKPATKADLLRDGKEVESEKLSCKIKLSPEKKYLKLQGKWIAADENDEKNLDKEFGMEIGKKETKKTTPTTTTTTTKNICEDKECVNLLIEFEKFSKNLNTPVEDFINFKNSNESLIIKYSSCDKIKNRLIKILINKGVII